ncbi:MAG: ankyrin repeat domain-containing protein [Halobacteriovoraceae bacterium]|nr:ankyrin repeat domain-containing protein [Halobacteriovoraceae bacterium]MCB9095119.1 ankyrin repeat domain-containing protein [Halobacteriovoraceae bacterium]
MKTFFFLILVLNTSFLYGQNSLNDKLMEELLRDNVATQNIVKKDRVIDFLNQGANPNFVSNSGESTGTFIAETLATITLSGDQEAIREAKSVLEVLISRGLDINYIGPRGYNVPLGLLRYGNPQHTVSMVSELIQRGLIDFSRGKKTDPLYYFARFYSMADTTLKEWVFNNIQNFKNYLTMTNPRGQNFLHTLVTEKSQNFQNYLETVSKVVGPQFSKLLNTPDDLGQTPLFYAVFATNTEGLDLLLKNYDVEINNINQENKTVLDIAKKMGNKNIIKLLLNFGAQLALQSSYFCKEELLNATYREIKRKIKKCRISSVEEVIKILPRELKSTYALNYFSRGLMKGNLLNPRVLSFTNDGSFYLTFNGDPELPGYQNIEILEYNKRKQTFSLHALDFSKSGDEIFSQKNPQKCLSCHGKNPKPLWDNWTLWPGYYFGDVAVNFKPLEVKYHEFLEHQKTHPRYSQLLKTNAEPMYLDLGYFFAGDTDPGVKPTKLDFLVSEKIAQKAAAEVARDPRLNKLAPSLLAGLSCEFSNINDYLPEEYKVEENDFLDFEKKLYADFTQEFNDRIRFQESIFPYQIMGRYTLQYKLFGNEYPGQAGMAFNKKDWAHFLFIAHKLVQDKFVVRGWFSGFHKTPYAAQTRPSMHEYYFWKKLVRSNKILRKHFSKIFKDEAKKYDLLKLLSGKNFIKDADKNVQYCKILKELIN